MNPQDLPPDLPPSEAELQAWVDDRLDADARLRVEGYLALNPSAASRLERCRAQNADLGAALRARFPEEVPARFRVETLARGRARGGAAPLGRVAALVGALVVGALAGGGGVAVALRGAGGPMMATGGDPTLARDALLAHNTYTVEERHFVEVAASEPHLLRWLSNRLGARVVAPDLGDVGYSLIGGRVVPTLDGLAAQLMYEDAGGARLTVYLRADAPADDPTLRFEAHDGANGVWWSDHGVGYALFAPIDRERLLGAAESIQRQVGS